MTDKPKINISGGVSDFKKKERKVNPDRIRTSSFFVSLNTNNAYKAGVNDEHVENDTIVFEEVMQDILNHIDQYLLMPEGHWDDKYIVSTDAQYVIELGTKKHNFHFHGLLTFKHKTAIKLDFKKIKTKVCDELGLKNLHLDVKIVRGNNTENVLQYIDKFK
jgi:hypothetical protein